MQQDQQYTPPQVVSQQPQQQEHGGYRGRHPVAAFFHVVFKLLAILVYFLSVLTSISYVGLFIALVLFVAADFWTVKNISGRLLVGLRWWNEIKEDGESIWVFESAPDASQVSDFDSYFFWWSTYGICVIWAALAFFSLTSLQRLPITLLALVLSASNAIGYTKCRRDAKKKMTQFLMGQAVQHPGLVAQAVAGR